MKVWLFSSICEYFICFAIRKRCRKCPHPGSFRNTHFRGVQSNRGLKSIINLLIKAKACIWLIDQTNLGPHLYAPHMKRCCGRTNSICWTLNQKWPPFMLIVELVHVTQLASRKNYILQVIFIIYFIFKLHWNLHRYHAAYFYE